MADTPTIATLNVVGAHPALDFANTVGALPDGTPREYLVDYANLVSWAQRLGVLGRSEASALKRHAEAEPDGARRALTAARDLRGAIYGLFAAHAVGAAPAADAVERFNRHLARAQSHTAIVPTRDGFAWRWTGEADALERPLWVLARSAADLLTDARLERVRQCAGDNCLWLFLDTSKNGSRRWCSMSDCGNRAKVRRFRERPESAE
jgi:predicted RNA-binding Zn ribbon-like protein